MVLHDTAAKTPNRAIATLEVVDAEAYWGIRLMTALPVEPDSFWDATTAPSNVPELETVAARAFGKVAVAETTSTPTEGTMASQSRVSPTYRLIRNLKVLFETPEEERWPGTTWPVQKAFEDARKFISKLPLADIPEPEIRFADDGEINFLWMIDNIHIDLGFYGTGSYSYFGRDGEGREIQDENVPAIEGPAKEIVTMLTA